MSECEMSVCDQCKVDVVPVKKYDALAERLDVVEGEFISLLNALYQLEDPRGGCVLQDLRLRGEAVVDHDSNNQAKKVHIRAEFERSMATS
jgi:hypothetical protein